MKPFAIEPDDRAFALARDGVVLESSPSAVVDGSGDTAVGAEAWHLVRRLPTMSSTRHLGSVLRDAQPSARALSLLAAELARRLEAHPRDEGERLWIAAAAACATALGGARPAIVIELGLHHVAATLIERDSGPVGRRRSLVSERGGLWPLYQGWLELINTTMVRQTRFDALHDAATEQQLFDALPGLARAAAASGVATASVTVAGQRIEVPLTRDQLAHAAQPVCREIAQLVQGLRSAGNVLELLVPGATTELPGLREMLASFHGCELVSLPAGFAAAATSLLDLPPRGATEPVRLLRQLPPQAQPALAARVVRASPDETPSAAPPSHVLFARRTFDLLA